MSVKDSSIVLPGVEIRCGAKVLKRYDGVEKLKTCGALVAVVNGACPGLILDIKCRRCPSMIRHRFD